MEPIIEVAALLPERPVAALAGADQVVIVRLTDERVFAVGQHDPFSGANVMARGIVGSVLRDGEEIPTLQSPLYKQAFDLRTGEALGDVPASLGTWAVSVVDGVVLLGDREAAARPVEEKAS